MNEIRAEFEQWIKDNQTFNAQELDHGPVIAASKVLEFLQSMQGEAEPADLWLAVRNRRGDQSYRSAAKEIGISTTALCKVESGHMPDSKTLAKLGDWMGVKFGILRNHPQSPAVPEGYVLVPVEPTDGLLISMACRTRHDFGLLSRGMQESIMGSMKQIHEEVVGTGFYKLGKDAEYKAMLTASGKGGM